MEREVPSDRRMPTKVREAKYSANVRKAVDWLMDKSQVKRDGLIFAEHPSETARYEIMKTYYAMLAEKEDADVVGKMKQFATYFTHGVRNGARLRAEIYQEREVQPIRDRVEAFFERELESAA